MAKRTKRALQRIRVDQFEQQIAEEVLNPDSLYTFELSKEDSVTVYVPIDLLEQKEIGEKLEEVGDDLDAGALVIFANNPEVSAEEQLALWKKHGKSLSLLIRMYAMVNRDVNERLGELKPKS
ncbi:hypothetical protein V5R04_15615 [Jonesiaceae bacterium BS-20]|uniref:Uncharacterized protein n=1 Tax=Jonesiaceae bacterium BS-20 TaxID=3120821 RepID=A0AAU7DXC8_9MICO